MTDLIPIISTATAAAAFFVAAEVSTISTATTIIIMTYTQSLSKCSLVSSPSLLSAGSSDSYPAVLFSAFISRLFTPLLFTTSSASPPPLSHFTSLPNKCAYVLHFPVLNPPLILFIPRITNATKSDSLPV